MTATTRGQRMTATTRGQRMAATTRGQRMAATTRGQRMAATTLTDDSNYVDGHGAKTFRTPTLHAWTQKRQRMARRSTRRCHHRVPTPAVR
eukprot:jgi/Mesvir1/7450/Mv25809-RA.1